MNNPALMSILSYVLIFVVFYALLVMPQRKRDKQIREMLNAVKEGDKVVTVGGIIGVVTHIKDDEVSIETGLERTKIKIAKWAIKNVIVENK